MTEHSDVRPEWVARLRTICSHLPEAYEDQPWTGNRFRIRKRTFAHILTIDSKDAVVTILVFRSEGPELEMLTHAGHPFHKAGYGHNVIVMIVEDDTDWDEVAELVTESYCIMAPKKLAALVDRPR